MGVFLCTTLFSGFNAAAQGNWELQGNAISATDFMGSTNDEDVVFKTNNLPRLILKKDGTLGLGTVEPKGMFEILYCTGGSPFEGGLIVTHYCPTTNVPVIVDYNQNDMIITNPNLFFTSSGDPEGGTGGTPLNTISLPNISFRTYFSIPVAMPAPPAPKALNFGQNTNNI